MARTFPRNSCVRLRKTNFCYELYLYFAGVCLLVAGYDKTPHNIFFLYRSNRIGTVAVDENEEG
jgi:hypothetical protein